jgi:EAL domain-containing protein (putative c-di-GMP-specific phosphodiesterase class I)
MRRAPASTSTVRGSTSSVSSPGKQLPVDVLKIDKSLVSNMATDEDEEKIVRSTIDLAHSLGLTVVAEGVETAEIMDRLSSLGCDMVQGYSLSYPVPADELTAWVEARKSERVPASAARRKPGSGRRSSSVAV